MSYRRHHCRLMLIAAPDKVTWGGWAPTAAFSNWAHYLSIAGPSCAMVCANWWCVCARYSVLLACTLCVVRVHTRSLVLLVSTLCGFFMEFLCKVTAARSKIAERWAHAAQAVLIELGSKFTNPFVSTTIADVLPPYTLSHVWCLPPYDHFLVGSRHTFALVMCNACSMLATTWPLRS